MTIDMNELKAFYPLDFSLGESGREIRASAHGWDDSMFLLVMGSWDCECESGYIHWAERMGGEDECVVRGMREEDMPEARLYEIAADAANCRPGFLADNERAAFLAAFEDEGWGDRMRAHFAANKASWGALAQADAAVGA